MKPFWYNSLDWLFSFFWGGWVPNRTSRQKPRLTQLWSKYGVKVLIIITLFPLFFSFLRWQFFFFWEKLWCNLDVYTFVNIYGKDGAFLFCFYQQQKQKKTKKEKKKGHDMQFAFVFNRFTRSGEPSLAIGCHSFSCVSTYTKWKICSKTTYFPFLKKTTKKTKNRKALS